MSEVTLASGMKSGEAKARITAAWPRLPLILYRPTAEHDKEGRPGAEDLELGADDELCRTPGGEAAHRGAMTGQNLLHAMMSAFSLETHVTDVGIRGV